MASKLSYLEQYPEKFPYMDEFLPGLSPNAKELERQITQIIDIVLGLNPVSFDETISRQRASSNQNQFPQLTLF